MAEKNIVHSIYSPSQLPRIMRCTASVFESSFIPLRPPSKYAEKGTMLHDRVPQVWDNGKARVIDLELDDQGYVFDCIEYLAALVEQIQGDHVLKFEQKVDLAPFGLSEVYGYSDVTLHDVDKRRLHVIDWKFGHGVQVHVENNEQLLAYAAGAAGYPAMLDTIVIHLVQPPLDYFAPWEISYKELCDWVFLKLAPKIEEAKGSNYSYNPGEKQCRFCPANMRCRARHGDTVKKAQAVFKAASDFSQVSNAELAKLLKDAKDIERYLKQLYIFAAEEISHGRPFPGYKLVSGRSQRKWVSETAAMGWLENHSSIKTSDLYSKKPISPAQAEKLDRLLKKDDNFKALIHKPPGKPQLVEEGDKRPALPAIKDATDVFEEV